MKLFRLFTIVVSLVLSACGGQPADAQELNYPQGMQNCTVELNGDSVMFGYITNGTTWRLDTTPAQWLRNKGYAVVDKSAGGLRTYDLVRGYLKPWPDAWPEVYPNGAQVAFWNQPHDSRIIVIQTGINDFKDPYNPQQVYNDYAYLVDYIRGLGKIPVITGITQVSPDVGTNTYNKIASIRQVVKNVAIAKNVHYASWDANPVWYTDGFHLNQASSNGVAENLRYVLSVICGVPF